MTSIFSWIIAGFLILFIIVGIIGIIPLILNRLRRESKGDVFLMKNDSNNSSLPVEIRAQRDYRYKDANINSYEKD